MERHPALVNRQKVMLLLVDIQDRVNQAMQHPEMVIDNNLKLIEGFKLFDAPILATEQYPKGLGPTNERIRTALPRTAIPQSKTDFSCCGDAPLYQQIKHLERPQVVVTGIESHVCVFQTAMDLLANGFQIFIPVDAVSSRKETDWSIAMRRAEQAGIIITTTEAVLFEMLQAAGTTEFKTISKLVK